MWPGESQIGRQSSVCQLADKHKKKANRAKRCKSLLLLSSPFAGSSSSVKSSLLSLWTSSSYNVNQNQQNQFEDDRLDLDCADGGGGGGGQSADRSEAMGRAPAAAAASCYPQQTPPAAKCNVKMKLFEQPLDKLFSPKAMKQLNLAINSLNTAITGDSTQQQQQQQHFLSKRKRAYPSSAACLRKFTAANLLDTTPNSNNNNSNNNNNIKQVNLTKSERHKLLLACLPQPIRNLLNELYLRGPSTVGIFRKSPNAKHCKELRQKLETDSQSSIEQFQVTVIASVFKEWLRSLPDCLLMSRLYPQWIDVAKLIEPLYQHQLQQQQSQSLDDSGCSDTSTIGSSSTNTSPRPSVPSPLTDNASEILANLQASAAGQQQQQQQQLRTRSCSTMITTPTSSTTEFHSINRISRRASGLSADDRSTATSTFDQRQEQQQQPVSMSAFALSDRHSECLRIVCQLLEALNEANLILLRSFICVLWHIANNSQLNKMSANNLGVCVGQSLLNDEHQSYSGKSGSAYASGSTFTKRHRRSRSQCLLSSTLSLASASTLMQSGGYLDSSGAQETAKYVPMLVAYMIENAAALFGRDVGEMFQDQQQQQQQVSQPVLPTSGCLIEQQQQQEHVGDNGSSGSAAGSSGISSSSSSSGRSSSLRNDEVVAASAVDYISMDKENIQSPDSFDDIDSGANSSLDDNSPNERHVMNNPMRQEIFVESCYKSASQEQQQQQLNQLKHPIYSTTNLNSTATLNSLQQQQDIYLLYHRAALIPQRSHVMSLRNYYLSLHQMNQQQQWQSHHHHHHHHHHRNPSYRNSVHNIQSPDQILPHQQRQQQALIQNKLNQSSHEQYPAPGFVAQQQRHFIATNQQQQQQPQPQPQPLRQIQQQTQRQLPMTTTVVGTDGNLMAHHQAVQRPQPRLAKIRQNQFNGIYVKNGSLMANHHSLINLAPSNQNQVKTKLKPFSSTSSDDHSSDESDDYLNDWAESTMV